MNEIRQSALEKRAVVHKIRRLFFRLSDGLSLSLSSRKNKDTGLLSQKKDKIDVCVGVCVSDK